MGNLCGKSWCPLSEYVSARSELDDTEEARLAADVRTEADNLSMQLSDLTKERQRNLDALKDAFRRKKGGDASASTEIETLLAQIEAGTASINAISKQVSDCRKSLHIYATRTVVKRNVEVSTKVQRLLNQLDSKKNRNLAMRVAMSNDAVGDSLDDHTDNLADLVPDPLEMETPENAAMRVLDQMIGPGSEEDDAGSTQTEDEIMEKIQRAMGIQPQPAIKVAPPAPVGLVGKRVLGTERGSAMLSATSDETDTEEEEQRTNRNTSTHRSLLAAV